MHTILHSSTSLIHILAALLAMLTGTFVLLTSKGTTVHRLVGWLYCLSMSILLFTAFQIYTLWGHFGIVHWGAVGSSIALVLGMASVGLRTIIGSWLRWHYLGMGVSVTGLYAAFLVESTYRFFPPFYFWWVSLGLSIAVFAIGGFLLHGHYPTWAGQRNQLVRQT
jgi:uncharacterized membrane protein